MQVELNREVCCQASSILGARQFLCIISKVPVSPLTCSSSTSLNWSSSSSYIGFPTNFLSAASKPRRPCVGQTFWRWPCSPHEKHQRAFGREGRASAGSVSLLAGRVLYEAVAVSRVVADLLSSDRVVLRGREFSIHWFVLKRDCCSMSTACWRASETEQGSNWWSIVWSCGRNPAIKRATNWSSETCISTLVSIW